MHEDIVLDDQLKRMTYWEDPIVDAVVATVLYRHRKKGEEEFLITKRLRGLATGYLQGHHGGFIKPTDKSVRHAAVREVEEETGIMLDSSNLVFAGRIGPELYRSKVEFISEKLLLEITNEQAEPGTAFVLDLFVANATDVARRSKTDNEVSFVGWMTLNRLVKEYGQSAIFNYWSFMSIACQTLKKKINHFPESSPGQYIF